MVISLANKGTLEIKPSAYIVLSELWSIYECFSQARAEINMDARQQRNEIMESHFGKSASIISIGSTAALFLCLIVMGINFGIGLVMGIITLIVHSVVTKPVKSQLQKITEEAKNKKYALKEW